MEENSYPIILMTVLARCLALPCIIFSARLHLWYVNLSSRDRARLFIHHQDKLIQLVNGRIGVQLVHFVVFMYRRCRLDDVQCVLNTVQIVELKIEKISDSEGFYTESICVRTILRTIQVSIAMLLLNFLTFFS